jgi:hypothetical protein
LPWIGGTVEVSKTSRSRATLHWVVLFFCLKSVIPKIDNQEQRSYEEQPRFRALPSG